MATVKKWETYEEVARHLLNEFSSKFGLQEVKCKQHVQGSSQATWEIDAKGVCLDGDSFVIVECKRQLLSGIKQSTVASLAYQISDIGAKGGIIVSPIGFQSGAKKVASSENIIEVKLHPDSTYDEYFLEFMGSIFQRMRIEIDVVKIQSVRTKVSHSIRVDIGTVGITGVKHVVK